ncbi:MAG: hypothetical protein ABF274_09425 [Nonlabens sp.]|uniref:hypothetical protein n=1 Tax=Nonlabens sp. TaxID=1888209 RepID=UPI00321B09B1
MNLDSKNVEKVDKIVASIYIALGLLLIIIFNYQLLEIELIQSLILFFGIWVSLMLYAGYYKRLRSLKVTLVWSVISIVQILIYFIFKDEISLFDKISGTYLNSMFYLPTMLICFHSCNFLNLAIHKDHYIITTGVLDFVGSRNYDQQRRLRATDFVFSFLGAFGTLFLATFLF